jgi:hypothetical protein
LAQPRLTNPTFGAEERSFVIFGMAQSYGAIKRAPNGALLM